MTTECAVGTWLKREESPCFCEGEPVAPRAGSLVLQQRRLPGAHHGVAVAICSFTDESWSIVP